MRDHSQQASFFFFFFFPVTLLDCWLEGTEIIVLDAAQWASLQCIACGHSEVKDCSWHTNATSSKGGGGIHTTYLLSKKRSCVKCSVSWLDHMPEALMQLPHSVCNLLPVARSEKSGLERSFTDLMLALIPEGVTFSMWARAYNQLMQTQHVRQALSHYQLLQEQLWSEQERFVFPPLDQKNQQLNVHYAIDTYVAAVEPMIKQHLLLQQSLASPIIKIDGNYKVGQRQAVTDSKMQCHVTPSNVMRWAHTECVSVLAARPRGHGHHDGRQGPGDGSVGRHLLLLGSSATLGWHPQHRGQVGRHYPAPHPTRPC